MVILFGCGYPTSLVSQISKLFEKLIWVGSQQVVNLTDLCLVTGLGT